MKYKIKFLALVKKIYYNEIKYYYLQKNKNKNKNINFKWTSLKKDAVYDEMVLLQYLPVGANWTMLTKRAKRVLTS